MKLYIASDIHGSAANLERLLNTIGAALDEDPDIKVVFLGDTYNHGPRNPFPERYSPMEVARMLNDAMQFITVIKGNCDSEVDEMISNFPIISDFNMEWEGITLYFTHGHKFGPQKAPTGAKKGDVVFYGHTHVYKTENIDGINYVNPGSISLPFNNNPRTYAVLEGRTIEIKQIEDNKTILTYNF